MHYKLALAGFWSQCDSCYVVVMVIMVIVRRIQVVSERQFPSGTDSYWISIKSRVRCWNKTAKLRGYEYLQRKMLARINSELVEYLTSDSKILLDQRQGKHQLHHSSLRDVQKMQSNEIFCVCISDPAWSSRSTLSRS